MKSTGDHMVSARFCLLQIDFLVFVVTLSDLYVFTALAENDAVVQEL